MPGLQTGYLWNGEGSSDAEKSCGGSLMESFFQAPEVRLTFAEGEESGDFWDAVGG